jgi:hypothetical protein
MTMRRLTYLAVSLSLLSWAALPALAQAPAGPPDGTITVAPGATWRIDVGPAGTTVTAGGGSVALPPGATWRVDGAAGAWTIGVTLAPPAAGPVPANAPKDAGKDAPKGGGEGLKP